MTRSSATGFTGDPDTTEAHRRIGNVIRTGVITAVDTSAVRCRVLLEQDEAGLTLETGWLPWQAGRAGRVKVWSPPTVGEQVAVVSQAGDPALGYVVTGIFCDANPAPTNNASMDLVEFASGVQVGYDQTGGKLFLKVGPSSIVLSATGIKIVAPLVEFDQA